MVDFSFISLHWNSCFLTGLQHLLTTINLTKNCLGKNPAKYVLALFWHFLWSTFRSPLFTSVFLLMIIIITLYLTHVWLCVDLVFAQLLAIQYLFFLFYFYFLHMPMWRQKYWMLISCKLSFINWVEASIFEIHVVNIYRLVKFEFQSMSSKILQVFE